MNCPKCGSDAYDNSEKVAGGWKGPLKKCKAECGWIVWPPRAARANGPAKLEVTAPAAPKRSDAETVDLYTGSVREVLRMVKAVNGEKDPVVVFTGTDVASMSATLFIGRTK